MAMSQTIEAIYEDGVLKPLGKLALGEHEKVQVTVEPLAAAVATGGPMPSHEQLKKAASRLPPPAEWFDEESPL
jgi:predicted DNA-binding antitoxin AbrB/MazE fold protein